MISNFSSMGSNNERRKYNNRKVMSVTGGTVSDITINGVVYRLHTFTSGGILTVSAIGDISGIFDALIVGGGGGGGGDVGGGGGGGQVLRYSNISLPIGTSEIGVAQQTAAPSVFNGPGKTGGNSYINNSSWSKTALGGTGGSGRTAAGDNLGWTGGGASYNQARTTGLTGLYGGNASIQNSATDGNGGGGGAGSAGQDGNSSKAGDGGIGLASSITGSTVYYGGGGGGSYYNTTSTSLRGAGGLGGGGYGGVSNPVEGQNGTSNTGGGGGGSGSTPLNAAGLGASGIVIVRYPLYI